jgi:large subunit ribosomal protein L15
MKLHALKSIKKRSQRIGRSGKRGSYSGRGVKGQKSRSGRRLRPAERDLIMRLPKLRGFRNKPKTDTVVVFNLGALAVRFKSLAGGSGPFEINREVLRGAHLIKKDFKGVIKLLGTGTIAFPISVKGLRVSKSAKMKIEKAGGTVATAA